MAFQIVRQLSQEQQELVREVCERKLTPDRAEELSNGMGHGPIAEELECWRYRVDSMPAWTLPMPIAWILWRDIEEVTKLHDPYRSNNFCWEAVTLETPNTGGSFPLPALAKRSFRLKRLEPATFLSVSVIRHNSRKITMRCRDAQDAKKMLWDKLVSGDITATALDAFTGDFKHVDPRRWTHLESKKI